MSSPNHRYEPEYLYDDTFLYDPGPLFWPVLHEVLRSDPPEIEVPDRIRRLTLNMERPNKNAVLRRLLKGSESANAPFVPNMTPMVAMIAGQVWKTLHRVPDTVSVSVYRDGRDFVGWHVDYEALLGPSPGDAWVCIVSLGAPRWLDFAPLPRLPTDGDPEPCHSVRMTSGSLMVMRGKTHRNFLHRVRADEPDQGPRISLTYLFEPPASREGYPWMLLPSSSHVSRALPMPLYVGEPEAVVRFWETLRDQQLAHEHWDRSGSDAKNLLMIGPSGESHMTLRHARSAFFPPEEDAPDTDVARLRDGVSLPHGTIARAVKMFNNDQLAEVQRLATEELATRGSVEAPPGLADDTNDDK